MGSAFRLPVIGLVGVVGLATAFSTGSAHAAPQHSGATAPLSSISRLVAVDAVTATDAWAVGETLTDGVASTLIEHWDGTGWLPVASPNPGGLLGTTLTGVSAVSADDVWAVGSYGALLKGARSLVLHWDGAIWSKVSTPNPSPTGDNKLLAVTAVSANDVWAVGWHTSSLIAAATLTEHWDGASWTVVPSPNPSRRFSNTLSGVSAIGADDMWAVGSYSTSASTTSTFALRWNGHHWFRPNSPNPGSLGNQLHGVSARATKDVWAVGDSSSIPTETSALIERWNGRLWRIVPGPDLGGASSSLLSVSAATKKDAWAVGYVDEGGVRQTLTAHWDGLAWTRVPSPSPGAFGNALHGVLAGGPSSAWAMGTTFSSAIQADPLIVSWNGEEWRTW